MSSINLTNDGPASRPRLTMDQARLSLDAIKEEAEHRGQDISEDFDATPDIGNN